MPLKLQKCYRNPENECLESKKLWTDNQLHLEYIDQPSGKQVAEPNPVVDHITIEDSIAQSLQEMSITQKSSLGSHDDEKLNRESNILKTPLNNLRSSLNPRKCNSNFYRSTPLSSKKPTNISPHEHFEQYEQEFNKNAADVKSPTTNYFPIQDFIHMDISVDVNEDDLANTVDMNSIQQVLAKSGVLNTTTYTNETKEIERKGTMAESIETSEICNQHELDLISKKNSSTELTSDFEVVMDSYISHQSVNDETHIDDSDVIEPSF
ncbi:hypothetical protein MN116_006732 [Schistosoma mekongi]|uniref:Uncharacterized protein n=1 Tax=Schistosoma mekongi TaxID=38744 RepID=A0AAE2D3P7_SCHME|nr:hypothetical protein MN116_006732 [Schistosoma mekongi]